MQVCFTCGSANPPGAAECETCGADMPGAQKVSSATPVASSAPMEASGGGTQVCFHCGFANPGGSENCDSCGQPMPRAEPSASAASAAEGSGQALATVETRCPYCDVVVPQGTKRCPSCTLNIDASDPLNQPAPRGHENNLTKRYEEFAAKVEAVRLGRMAREAFAIWLAEIKKSLEDKRNGYIQMIRESGYYDHHPDEVDLGMDGILDFEEAIEDMCEFALGHVEQSVLDGALEKMWKANEKVNDAMRINRSFRAQLEEDWGYM